jgi:hypothetical protein
VTDQAGEPFEPFVLSFELGLPASECPLADESVQHRLRVGREHAPQRPVAVA